MEFFIENVKHHPCLWNMSHIAYRDNERTSVAWERIARTCGMANGLDAKCQWKKLRDSHREALRRRNGPCAQNMRPWKYEEEMKFLLLKTEKTEYFSDDPNDTQDSNDDAQAAPPSPTDSLTRYQKSKDYSDLLEQRDKRRDQRQTEREDARRQTIDSHRQDALGSLFESLCQKTRELPKYLQLRVEREVFEAVTRAEEEALSFHDAQ